MFTLKNHLIHIILLVYLSLSANTTQADNLREVVILNSYHNGFKWTNNINNAIAVEFSNDGSTRLFYEFMDSKRFNSVDYFNALKNIYHLKYSNHKIDGIICSDNRAFDFFLKYGEEIWGDIPAVFCGVNNIDEQLHLIDTSKHSIVYEKIDIKGTIQLISELQPEIEELIVISDATLSGHIFLNQFINGCKALEQNLKYKIINNTDPDTLKHVLLNIPKKNRAIYLLSLYTNRNNIPNEMINESHYFFKEVKIPLYSNWDFLMPNLIVGGKILKAQDQGAYAARLMKSFLAGKKTPVHNRPENKTILDHTVLDKYNLSTDKLSNEFHLINEQVTWIKKYRQELTIILVLLIVFVFIILLLVGDIIKRKAIEINFIESEKRLELAINGANEGLWDINIPTKLIYTSDQFAELLGYSASSKLKLDITNWQKFILPQDVEQVKEAYNLHKTGKAEAFQCEIRLLKKNGMPSWFSIHGKITEKINGEPMRITGIILDINTQKAFEKELKNAKEKAEESDRLKSSFLANMSHEIRTPMNAILGFTDLLIDSTLTASEKHDYLNLIKRSGENLLTLINDIIDISKIESGELKIKKKKINIIQLINEVVNVGISLSNTLNKKIEIRTTSPLKQDHFFIVTDSLRVYQILINLVSNAVKFTDEGYVEIKYNIDNDAILHLSIKDTGPGISDENKKIIFDRFRQVDESTIKQHGGTGLGLSITQSLINLLGGNINVISKPKEGAEFVVNIPVKISQPKETI